MKWEARLGQEISSSRKWTVSSTRARNFTCMSLVRRISHGLWTTPSYVDFKRGFFVPLPDYYARLEMFKLYSKNIKLSTDVDFDELSTIAEGYSPSDIRDIFQSIQIKIVRQLFDKSEMDTKTKLRDVEMEDFKGVFKERKPSVSKEMLRYYEKWYDTYKAL